MERLGSGQVGQALFFFISCDSGAPSPPQSLSWMGNTPSMSHPSQHLNRWQISTTLTRNRSWYSRFLSQLPLTNYLGNGAVHAMVGSMLCHAEQRAVREIREFREFKESSLTSLISLISLTSLSHPLTPINTINTTPTPCYCVTMLINSEECGEAPEARQPNLLSWWCRWGAITRKQRLSTHSYAIIIIFFLRGVVATA